MPSREAACAAAIFDKLERSRETLSVAGALAFAREFTKRASREYLILRVESLAIVYFLDRSLIPGVTQEIGKNHAAVLERVCHHVMWVYWRKAPPSAKVRESLGR